MHVHIDCFQMQPIWGLPREESSKWKRGGGAWGERGQIEFELSFLNYWWFLAFCETLAKNWLLIYLIIFQTNLVMTSHATVMVAVSRKITSPCASVIHRMDQTLGHCHSNVAVKSAAAEKSVTTAASVMGSLTNWFRPFFCMNALIAIWSRLTERFRCVNPRNTKMNKDSLGLSYTISTHLFISRELKPAALSLMVSPISDIYFFGNLIRYVRIRLTHFGNKTYRD